MSYEILSVSRLCNLVQREANSKLRLIPSTVWNSDGAFSLGAFFGIRVMCHVRASVVRPVPGRLAGIHGHKGTSR